MYADINVRDDNGNTALIEATNGEYVEVAKYLKSKGAKEWNFGVGFVLGALAVCAVYADINKDLLDSAENGDMIKVKSLIKQGADVNAKK